ncbi:hypothetical protein ACSYT7_06185, partial [Escherichia coli]
MAYADQKLCENSPCCLWLTLSRRPAIIRFVILNTKCYSSPMRGEEFMENDCIHKMTSCHEGES